MGGAGRGAVARARRQGRPLDQVRVEVPVAVEVEESGAGAHDLGQQVATGSGVAVLEDQADFCRALLERERLDRFWQRCPVRCFVPFGGPRFA